jgi:hypothetical protein
MKFGKFAGLFLGATILLAVGSVAARADETEAGDRGYDREGVFGITGDAGYYTYGMNDVNTRFQDQGGNGINGGLGYGGALKFDFTRRFAVKAGVDYLTANSDTTRTIGGTQYNAQVNLPATMILLGGEYVFLPTRIFNLKLLAAYSLISIFNGKAPNGGPGSTDLGSVAGSGSGAQLGLGAEFFLARGFSIETDLAYNFAKINGATFAGSPSDTSEVSSSGVVDYSGMVAKLAVTFYLIR